MNEYLTQVAENAQGQAREAFNIPEGNRLFQLCIETCMYGIGELEAEGLEPRLVGLALPRDNHMVIAVNGYIVDPTIDCYSDPIFKDFWKKDAKQDGFVFPLGAELPQVPYGEKLLLDLGVRERVFSNYPLDVKGAIILSVWHNKLFRFLIAPDALDAKALLSELVEELSL